MGRMAPGRQETQGQGQAGGPGPRAQLRGPADLLVPAAVGLRRGRGGQDGQEGRHQQQGRPRVGEVHAGVLEGRLRRGRRGLGRHEQQPGVPRGRAQRHAQRRVDLHRGEAPEGQDQGRQGRATLPGHRPRRVAAQGPGRPDRAVPALPALGHEVFGESEAGQGLPEVAASGRELREVVRGQRGVQRRLHQEVGGPRHVVEGRQTPAGVPAGGPPGADAGIPGTSHGQGHRVLHEVHHRGHVRQGRHGHQGGRCREVGRGRAEEDLRGVTPTGSELKKPIAGGAGRAAGLPVVLPRPRTSKRAELTAALENERLLAALLLAPALLLLGVFIAYPFVMGVWLSLSSTSVGNPGRFVGIANFLKAWNDSIFRTAFWNTAWYTFWATLFKLGLGMWLALLLNRHFKGKHLARDALLRHHAPGRPADDQPRSARGRLAGRRQRLEAVLARHLAAAQASDDRGGGVLGDPDVLGLPVDLRADRRRSRQLDPPDRDLRLPSGRGHRPARRGRRHLAVHAAGALHRRLGPAAIPPATRRRMMIERRWKKWVYFYIPLTLFVIGTLFPFYWMLITAIRPDVELYRSWRDVNNAPFWTLAPTLDHFRDLLEKTTFPQWLWNTFFIAVASTVISLFCGLLAGYALARLRFPMAGMLGTSIFVTYLVPPTLLFIPLADIIRNFQLGNTPWALILTYP